MNGFITCDEMLAIPALEISDMRQNSPEPLVSVIIITYNQERYISQTIEGILAQRCRFAIEIIIGEDNSKDQTQYICINYQKKYPNLIRIVTWHKNVGVSANFLRVWGRTRGKYVAICEGDDYWIEPTKLTKQVALMEQFPETSLCGARTRVLNEVPGKISTNAVIGAEQGSIEYSLKDVMATYLCHSSTFMFRKSKLRFRNKIRELIYIDFYLKSISAIYGSIRCLPDIVSVYRQHLGGIYTGSTPDLQYHNLAAVYGALMGIVVTNDVRYVKIGLGLVQYRRCLDLINNGRILEARQMSRKLLSLLGWNNLPQSLLLIFRVNLPKTYTFIKKLGESLGINRYAKKIIFNV